MPRRSRHRGARAIPALLLALTVTGPVARAAAQTEHGFFRSYDNRKIAFSYFVPDGASQESPVPLILVGHGWGGSRIKDATANPVATFLANGYAVATWDARGFGESHGEANVDSQEFEVRDVQKLIDLLVVRPEIATDDQDFDTVLELPCPGPKPTPSESSVLPSAAASLYRQLFTPSPTPSESPIPEPSEGCTIQVPFHHDAMDAKVGIYGGSYGGGIALMAAAADRRIDAIVPMIAWHDLPQSLKPNGVLKIGWDTLLYAGGLPGAVSGGLSNEDENELTEDPDDTRPAPITANYAPQIHQAVAEAAALNDWSSATYEWFAEKSPKRWLAGGSLEDGNVLPGIGAATLVIQGINDTLFPLTEGIDNFQAIKSLVGADKTKLIAFCGGHTAEGLSDPAYEPVPWPVPAQSPVPPAASTKPDPLASTCVPGPGQDEAINDAVLDWLARWVKKDVSVDTGPPVEMALQGGVPEGGDFEPRTNVPVTEVDFEDVARLKHAPGPTSGSVLVPTSTACNRPDWADPRPGPRDCMVSDASWMPVVTLTGPPEIGTTTPTPEFVKPGTILFGSPRLRVGVLGTGSELNLFFKLVDYDTVARKAVVIDDQVTALKVSWPSEQDVKWFTIQLNGVAWEVKEGHEIYLEANPSSADHSTSRVQSGASTLLVRAAVPVIPVPRIFSPRVGARGAFVNTRAATVSGTAERGAIITAYENDNLIATTTANATTGAWTVAPELNDGPHTVVVKATEAGGWAKPMVAAPFTFTVDTVAPGLPSITKPTEGQVMASKTVTFEGLADRGTRVRIRENGELLGSTSLSQTCTIVSGTQCKWNVSFQFQTSGAHSVVATSTDDAGNVTSTAERTFSVP